MAQLQRRAREALAGRMRAALPAGSMHLGGGHALRFADALVPTLSAGDVAWAHAQLAARARGELQPAGSGAVSAHGAWSSRFLDAGQLVRHALSLQATPGAELVLLFWEPGGAHPEVGAHREELAELHARLGADAAPRFHAESWADVLESWAPVRPAHVAAFRARYDVEVG